MSHESRHFLFVASPLREHTLTEWENPPVCRSGLDTGIVNTASVLDVNV